MNRAPAVVVLLSLMLACALATPVQSWAASADPLIDGDRAHADGDLATALVQWSLALQAARDAGDAVSELDLLLRLAAVNRDLGRLAASGELLGVAEGVAAGVDDPNAPGRVLTATSLLALAGGDARRAEDLARRAFELHRAHEDPVGAANAAVDLGLARRARGKADEAHRAFSAGLTLFETLGDPRGQADARVNLASLQRQQGQMQSAREHLEEARELFVEAGDAQGEADAVTHLGLLMQDLGQDARAEQLYRVALDTARQRKDVPRQAGLLSSLGTLAHARGDADAAQEHYLAAEEAFLHAGRDRAAVGAALNRALLGPGDGTELDELRLRARKAGDRHLEAVIALNMATLMREAQPAQAATAARRALQLADELELADVRWRALYLAGSLDLEEGRTATGVDRLKRAVNELELARRGLRREESRSFVLGHEEVYQTLIDALVDQGQGLAAMVYAERLQQLELGPPAAAPDDADAQQVQQLVVEQAWVGDALASELATRPDGGSDTERALALREQLSRMRVEFAETVDRLRASHPEFDRLVRVDPEDLEAIQGQLAPGVVVVQPVVLPDRLALLVLRREGLETVTVDVPAEEVQRVAGRLARSLRSGDTYDPDWTEQQCDKLGQWLLAPVAEHLEGADVVVVSKTGALRQLPFALLRLDGEYLVERAAVVGVTHIGSLRGSAGGGYGLRGEGLLLLGNPDGSLPGAEDEVTSLAEQFPGATLLLGEAGTREALYREAAGKSTVHLATHGVIDAVQPDRSHLVLHGGEGRLSYREIPGLAPYMDGCRLVVLSACESGRAVAAESSEDQVVSINGLAAQFRRAGVETLVGTLWKVDDQATLQLMGEFYAQLAAGADIAHAMQASQRALLDDPLAAHPWYWAAFEVVGDWR